MAGIDESLPFHPLAIAVSTISDTHAEENDGSGALLAKRASRAGHQLAGKDIVEDRIDLIKARRKSWSDNRAVDLIITVGGTEFAPRDMTPEAVRRCSVAKWPGFR